MKKSIALAPAVAIAISGFGVTAVSAAPGDEPTPAAPPAAEPNPTDDGAGDAPDANDGDDTGAGETTPEEGAESKPETQVEDDAETTDDAEAFAAPQMTIEPEVVEAEVVADENQGVTVTITGLQAESDVTDSLTGKTEQADENGNIVLSLFYKGDAADLEPGSTIDFTVDVIDEAGEAQTLNGSFQIAEDETASPTPTPTEDDDAAEDEWTWNGAPLEEGLNLEDDQVSTEKFVTDGVAFAVRGCEPGQDVNFEVRAGRDDVAPYTATVTADENGIAVHGVKGLDASQARAYIGEYTVTATCGDESWTDAFYVGDRGDDANPGDDSSDDNGSDDNAGGNELPRTGTELTGLAAGAGLLVLGAAAVFLTRRRTTGTGPADI